LTQTKAAPQEGTLKSFTKVYIDLDGKSLEKPELIGFVTFKGFEGGLIHRIFSKDEKKLKVGVKVKAVFEAPQKRKGSILDITHFESQL